MKARRRHELKENVLAHELGQLKEFLGKYGNWVFGGLAAAVIVLLVARHYVGRGQARYDEDKQRLEQLQQDAKLLPGQRLDKLTGLLETIENPVLAAEAAVWAGDLCVDEQLKALHEANRSEAAGYASKAEGYYTQVISKYPDTKLFVAKAHLGLGILAENAGAPAKAKEHYEEILRLVNSGYPVAQEAKRRLGMHQAWSRPVRFSTAPAEPTTATAPATGPSTAPAETQPK